MAEPVMNNSNNGPASQTGAASQRKKRVHFRSRTVFAFVVLIAAGSFVWSKVGSHAAIASGATIAHEPGATMGNGGGRAIPVVAARAQCGSIGVYITALGSVTPIQTIAVKTRVDGQLMVVHYKEGDMVKEDAPLVEIDSRPYQALLEQYEGQLKRDQALLANAKVDLARYATLMKTNAIPEQTYATQQASVAQDEGQVETDKGLIDATKLNIAYCHITAPISGLIGLRLVDPATYLRATFPNQDNALFPNQFVYTRLLIQQKHGVLLIPTAAVQRNANNTYAFIVNADSTVSIRNVELGTTNGDETEITKGLVPGDEV